VDQDEPQGIESDLSKPLGFGIWTVAATFLCVIAASAIGIALTLHWPVLKDHGGWQLAIFAVSALALGVVVFPAARKLDAREAARRQARSRTSTPTGVPTSSLVLGLLLFGGVGVLLVWVLVAGKAEANMKSAGFALFALTVASACARMLWRRIRRR